MPRADPVLIFDLDGTILRQNSFPHWVLTLLHGSRHAGLRARLATGWQVQRHLLRRKLRRTDHDAFLHALQAIWADAADAQAAARLQARLLRLVRPNLASALRAVKDGADALLATAAAAEYAQPLGHELGFRDVLATPCGPHERAPCNRGAVKRDRVMAFLGARGWTDRPRIFFTDHLDDLPLMQVCQTVCWFGGNHTLRAARDAAPRTRFVPCRSLRPEELHQTLAHVRQSLQTAQLARTAPPS